MYIWLFTDYVSAFMMLMGPSYFFSIIEIWISSDFYLLILIRKGYGQLILVPHFSSFLFVGIR